MPPAGSTQSPLPPPPPPRPYPWGNSSPSLWPRGSPAPRAPARAAPPPRGRPSDDAAVVGRAFPLDLAVEPADTRVSEPIEVAASLRGIGNVALWPEPTLRWPAGFRAYPAQTTTLLGPRDGLVAGTKTFRYLVVPDSAGSFLLPDVRYPYFDL